MRQDYALDAHVFLRAEIAAHVTEELIRWGEDPNQAVTRRIIADANMRNHQGATPRQAAVDAVSSWRHGEVL